MGVGAPIYPVGLVVKGRRCLVVGGGRVAARKIGGLLACGAAVTVVAPEVHVAIGAARPTPGSSPPSTSRPSRSRSGPTDRARRPTTSWWWRPPATPRSTTPSTATPPRPGSGSTSPTTPRVAASCCPRWHETARSASPCRPPAPVPALAGWLRDRVVEALGPGIGDLAALLEEGRRRVHDQGRSTETIDWRAVLDGPLPELVRQGRMDEARAALDAFLGDPTHAARVNRTAPRRRSPGRAMS